MSCEAKNRKDIKERGKPSIEFYFENKPRYFCYGYIDNQTDELIPECKKCIEHVYNADKIMKQLKNGENPEYDGLRNRNKVKENKE